MRLLQEIHEVVCDDETNSGRIIGESGSDNMVLAGVAISPTGVATRIPTIEVGSFGKDATVKRFNPARQFSSVPIAPNLSVPHRYQVLFVLAEKDLGGGTGSFTDSLVADANKAAKDSGKSDAAAGAILGELAKEVGKELLKAAAERLKKNAEDDIFKPQLQAVMLSTPGFRFANGKTATETQELTFNGHGGKYTVKYRWRVDD